MVDRPAAEEADRACAGIVEKTYARGACICPKNTIAGKLDGRGDGPHQDRHGVARGRSSVTFTGVPAGGWFGEGTVLKNEPRRYDIVALRDTRMAFMDRTTFMWLVENSVAFNRSWSSNSTSGSGTSWRCWNTTGCWMSRHGWRVALHRCSTRCSTRARATTWRSRRKNSAAFRHDAAGGHQSLKALEKDGVVRLEYGGVTVVDLDRLRSYGA